MDDDLQVVDDGVEVEDGQHEVGSSQVRTVADLTPDEYRQMLDDAAARAVAAEVAGTSQALAENIAALGDSARQSVVSGTVSVDPEQYLEMRDLAATELQGNVMLVGLLSLILGAVVATALTLHWRGSRG